MEEFLNDFLVMGPVDGGFELQTAEESYSLKGEKIEEIIHRLDPRFHTCEKDVNAVRDMVLQTVERSKRKAMEKEIIDRETARAEKVKRDRIKRSIRHNTEAGSW